MSQLGLYMEVAKLANWSDLNDLPDAFQLKQKKLIEFWKNNRSKLKYWFAFAMICYLHQPSSAAAERVFSILKRVLESGDYQALDDIVLAAVYTNYRTR